MNLTAFDFESICVHEESFKEIVTTKWIGNHFRISISISSNLVEQPIFLCHLAPHYLVASFIATLEYLASDNKVQIVTSFPEIETAKKDNWIDFWKLSANIVTNVDKSLKLKMYVFKKTAQTAALVFNSSKRRKTTDASASTFGTLL